MTFIGKKRQLLAFALHIPEYIEGNAHKRCV